MVLIYLFFLFLICHLFIHSFIGECYSEYDKAGGIFLQNISLLAGGNPFGHTKKSTNQEYFGKFVAIESRRRVCYTAG
jgi:hypothetical protein